MPAIPTTGFAASVETHNVRLDVMADWIEASILFASDELSPTDVVDALCEGNIYRNQDMAAEMVGNAWSELRRRCASTGGIATFAVTTSRIRRTRTHATKLSAVVNKEGVCDSVLASR